MTWPTLHHRAMNRVDRAARARAARACRRLADRMNASLPGAAATPLADNAGIAIAGEAVRADRLAEPALRWPAGLLR